jgi:hypothetical protein
MMTAIVVVQARPAARVCAVVFAVLTQELVIIIVVPAVKPVVIRHVAIHQPRSVVMIWAVMMTVIVVILARPAVKVLRKCLLIAVIAPILLSRLGQILVLVVLEVVL